MTVKNMTEQDLEATERDLRTASSCSSYRRAPQAPTWTP